MDTVLIFVINLRAIYFSFRPRPLIEDIPKVTRSLVTIDVPISSLVHLRTSRSLESMVRWATDRQNHYQPVGRAAQVRDCYLPAQPTVPMTSQAFTSPSQSTSLLLRGPLALIFVLWPTSDLLMRRRIEEACQAQGSSFSTNSVIILIKDLGLTGC